jgi:ethanolamine utilization microcompartment shell protein EutL
MSDFGTAARSDDAAAHIATYDVVGQDHREVLVPNKVCGAGHGVLQSAGLVLVYVGDLPAVHCRAGPLARPTYRPPRARGRRRSSS